MSTLRITLLSALFASAAFVSGTASAADRNVKIINKTKTTLVSFYASRVSTGNWEEDILGDDMLRPGQSITIDIDDGTGACRFDFKAEFEDGEDVVQEGVDVCKIGEFSFTE